MKNQSTLWPRQQSVGPRSLAGDRSKAPDWLPVRKSQSTNGKEPRERSKVSCLGCPWSSNLFTSSICVCVRQREMEVWHDNNMHHALCTHARKGASLHPRLNYTGLIGFFSSASKTKTLLSCSPPPLPPAPSIPSSLSTFSSQVFSICTFFLSKTLSRMR